MNIGMNKLRVIALKNWIAPFAYKQKLNED